MITETDHPSDRTLPELVEIARQVSAAVQTVISGKPGAVRLALTVLLAEGHILIEDVPGVEVVYPVQADAVFARLNPGHIAQLQRDWIFHVWDESASVVRWMTAFDTQESDGDAFLSDIAAAAGAVQV